MDNFEAFSPCLDRLKTHTKAKVSELPHVSACSISFESILNLELRFSQR
jgi:hypothetical protein